MEADVKSEGDDRRLNQLVAVTVVILSVFMAISKVKDDNINQAMQKAKAESVDAWGEYQSTRIKMYVDENALNTLRLLETTGSVDKTLAAQQAAKYEADIQKYAARSKDARAKAERWERDYERLNFRDDQFDISDALLAIAIALAAVAALADAWWLLWTAWGAGGAGILLGVAGFLGLNLRPEWLASMLGT